MRIRDVQQRFTLLGKRAIDSNSSANVTCVRLAGQFCEARFWAEALWYRRFRIVDADQFAQACRGTLSPKRKEPSVHQTHVHLLLDLFECLRYDQTTR
jgi:hypothetical protein